MIYKLSFRGQGDYGPVMPGLLTREDGAQGVSRGQQLYGCDSVTFLIHGFNVDRQEGVGSLSHLSKLLHSSDTEAIVYVLWPGDSPVGALSYSFTEGNQAVDTAVNLCRSIEEHVASGTRLNFIAHSLGCRVVLETIDRLHKAGHSRFGNYPVSQVCLMAAAVDDYCMSIPNKYKTAVNAVERLVVLSSVRDNVLKFIYPAGDLLQAFLFFWKETPGLALGYHGPVNYIEEPIFGDEDEEAIEHAYPLTVKPVTIPSDSDVDHGDYLPESATAINSKQVAAAKLANAVITGEAELKYDYTP